MSAGKKNTRGGRVGLFLFGTPFALIGIGTLFLAVVPSLYDRVRMQSWEPVNAELLSAELKRNHSSKSTTYKVIARYRYTFAGKSYEGNKVGINSGSDNIGDWHQRTYSRLRFMQPLRVWVNPSNPGEAIFDRELRWGMLGFYMLFVLLFGGVGIGIIWFALRRPAVIPEGVPLWQGNPAWRDNQIRSNARAGLWVVWAFTAFWNLVSSPIIFLLPRELAKGNHAALIGLLFPLVGLGAVVYAVNRTLEWRRFGMTPLQLDPFPGSIGGDVGGSIRLNQILPRDAVAELQLSCVHVYSSGSGKNRKTARDVQWQDSQQVHVEPGSGDTLIRFRFTTPEKLPESENKSMPYYEWNLKVSCKLPGADLDRTYEIPVFDAGSPRRSMVRPYTLENRDGQPAAQASVVQVSHTGQGLRLHFPVLRAPGAGLIATLVGGIFAGLALVFLFGGMKHPPPLIFPVIFGLVGSLVFLSGLYMLGNSLTVIANSLGVDVTRRVYGLAFRRHFPTTEIQAIRTARGMQSSQGSKTTLYYSVKLHTRDGRKITVAESLNGASAAEQVVRQIREACDIRG